MLLDLITVNNSCWYEKDEIHCVIKVVSKELNSNVELEIGREKKLLLKNSEDV